MKTRTEMLEAFREAVRRNHASLAKQIDFALSKEEGSPPWIEVGAKIDHIRSLQNAVERLSEEKRRLEESFVSDAAGKKTD